ncbi:MAG: tetratricopeptide repeat-containing serine protease family protein [Trichodesmium sp. ALOHA_ZT_67]|nr:tetratricopeptide repeat-containing serine protease family protein [Trichodesmium sp. ALOHA_ZT_67]
MKHITKLTVGLITIALVSCNKYESQISTDVSTKISRPDPIITARQDNAPLSQIALNRLAENITVAVVARSVVSGGDPFSSSGSGVIIGKQGSTYYVLTAKHIFQYQDDYRVVVRSKKPGEDAEILKLEIIYRYPDADLAVFKFASVKQYKVAEVGEASQLRKNSEVYVGGWPGAENREGFQFTPAKVTNPRAGDLLNYEPTVPGEGVYPGMSGGAVLNEAGQLMGIHVGLVKADGDGEGVLVSTFLRDIPQQVSRVLVRSTSAALPSPIPSPKNRAVGNTDNVTVPQIQDAESYYKQGNKHIDREEFEQAIADLNQAIQLNPKYAEAYYNRGIVYLKQGKYDLALADYNQAIQLNPKDAEAYNNRGGVYLKQGKYDLAIAEFNQAIQLNPKLAAPYYSRGLTNKYQRNMEKAISDFEKAADLYKQQGNQTWYQNSLDQLKKLRGS